MQKRLTKSQYKIIAGVFGGIAEYFNWDKAWTRICGGAIACFTGWGLLLYIIAAFAMPNSNSHNHDHIIDGEFHRR
ncbi:PspC domain-containing protein [Lactobacillus sp. ESL0785]|uniref:PspC domain-containing protein n=1 Tax=Lactobacillus sp. ESL0785 TaxID=2983232 RepID=UPI0023FA0CD1|nr:PspC domain-containing protein [Lactobacillus sp. ESL0785]WEV70452.1 PspC domain-containing protein [Lactobacillus sp. ESL0785]